MRFALDKDYGHSPNSWNATDGAINPKVQSCTSYGAVDKFLQVSGNDEPKLPGNQDGRHIRVPLVSSNISDIENVLRTTI